MPTLTAKPLALLGALALAAATSACAGKDDLTVWKTEVASPDQRWVATADTVQNGGFGSAHITTSVYLHKVGDSRPPATILALSCQGPIPHPYALDNVANAGGSVHLSLKWLDPVHLHVGYDAHPTVVFRAAQFQDVTVSVVELSGVASGSGG